MQRLPWALTQVEVPPIAYPAGDKAITSGATIVSAPAASLVVLETDPRAGQVRVTVSP